MFSDLIIFLTCSWKQSMFILYVNMIRTSYRCIYYRFNLDIIPTFISLYFITIMQYAYGRKEDSNFEGRILCVRWFALSTLPSYCDFILHELVSYSSLTPYCLLLVIYTCSCARVYVCVPASCLINNVYDACSVMCNIVYIAHYANYNNIINVQYFLYCTFGWFC